MQDQRGPSWHDGEDVEQFLAAAGDLLFGEPGVHTITLTVCENVRAHADGTRFGWWQEVSGEVTGCVSQTPGLPLVLGVLPDEAVAPLVEFWQVDGVNGPSAVAAHVAALAARRSGRTATLTRADRLFRLGKLMVPEAPGSPREADESDVHLLVEWFEAFITETGVFPQDVEEAVRDRLSYKGFVLWEDGGPVALAGHTRKAFQGARIGPVYTPPEHRGRGYGGAVTAAATQRAFDLGAWEVVLFTDLTNPTSNRLYPRLGYEPVTDRAIFLLSD